MELITEAHEPDPMVALPPEDRVYCVDRRPAMADCAPSGRIRMDALARWVQDVAYADVEDLGLERAALWVLRRCRIRVARFPVFGESCEVTTFCSGIGRMWCERRTTVTLTGADGDAAPLVDAVSLWVHLDPERRLPSPVSEPEREAYAVGAGARKVLARLRHSRPEEIESEWEWNFRYTDTDIGDHVNNAVYWEPLEDELLRSPEELTQIDAEIEFRLPSQPGTKRILSSGARRWITDPISGEVNASTILMNAVTVPGSD